MMKMNPKSPNEIISLRWTTRKVLGYGCSTLGILLLLYLPWTKPVDQDMKAPGQPTPSHCILQGSADPHPAVPLALNVQQFSSAWLQLHAQSLQAHLQPGQSTMLEPQLRNRSSADWKHFFKLMEVLPTYFFPHMKVIKCLCAKC